MEVSSDRPTTGKSTADQYGSCITDYQLLDNRKTMAHESKITRDGKRQTLGWPRPSALVNVGVRACMATTYFRDNP
ncbi:hypothetical protein J6590_011128 [Homalodisca vitripennis]|nr:hypothetical protein J6590_011128 [Homalodisca vitripennis]